MNARLRFVACLGFCFRALVRESKDYVRGTVRMATKTNKEGVNPGISEDDRDAARSRNGFPASKAARSCAVTRASSESSFNYFGSIGGFWSSLCGARRSTSSTSCATRS